MKLWFPLQNSQLRHSLLCRRGELPRPKPTEGSSGRAGPCMNQFPLPISLVNFPPYPTVLPMRAHRLTSTSPPGPSQLIFPRPGRVWHSPNTFKSFPRRKRPFLSRVRQTFLHPLPLLECRGLEGPTPTASWLILQARTATGNMVDNDWKHS